MANGNFGGGNGTENDPYLVEDAADLAAVTGGTARTLWYYKQVNNIELGGWGNWTPIQIIKVNNQPRYIYYNGDGYAITGLQCHVIVGPTTTHDDFIRLGLFDTLWGSVSNLYILDADVGVILEEGFDPFNNPPEGGFCPVIDAGIVAGLSYGAAYKVCVTGTVSGTRDVGGLFGRVGDHPIQDCCALVDLVNYYYSDYDTSIFLSKYGLMGYWDIYNDVGGLVGEIGQVNASRTFYRCYSVCTIDCKSVMQSGKNHLGPIVGSTQGAEHADPGYYDSSVFNLDTSGMLYEELGLPTTQIKDPAYLPEFDFDDVWLVVPEINDGYPIFKGGTIEETSVTTTNTSISLDWDIRQFAFDELVSYEIILDKPLDKPDSYAVELRLPKTYTTTNTTITISDLVADRQYRYTINAYVGSALIASMASHAYTNSAWEYLEGLGTEGEPFLIKSKADFEIMRGNSYYFPLGYYYKQVNDIDVGGENFDDPIGYWTGRYDGNGKTISNIALTSCMLTPSSSAESAKIENLVIDGLSVGTDDTDFSGVFYPNGTVIFRDVEVKNAVILAESQRQPYGVFTCYADDCTFENCTVHAVGTAGFFGQISACSVTNCHASIALTCTAGSGSGLMAQEIGDGSTLTNCSVTGTINSGIYNAGGFVSYTSGSGVTSFQKCAAIVDITTSQDHAGGFVAYTSATTEFSNCYTMGNISADSIAGGFCGAVHSDIALTNCYAVGEVNVVTELPYGSLVVTGGFIGFIPPGMYVYPQSCYYDSEVSGRTDTGRGEPRATAEMKTQDTFVDWDFTNIWAIEKTLNNGYPLLRWQGIMPSVTCRSFNLGAVNYAKASGGSL
jgi:hypothetical protein